MTMNAPAVLSENQEDMDISSFADEEEHSHASDTSRYEEGSRHHSSKEKREEIAATENKAVFCMRVLLLVILLSSAVAVVVSVYLYMRGQENEAFETKFHNDATKVFEAIGKTLDQTLGSTDAFLVKYMVHAAYSNSTWPYVTLPRFGLQAAKLLKLAKAFYCSMAVVVDEDARDEWQQYANESKGWIGQSLEIQRKDENWHGATDFEWQNSFNYELWGFTGPVDGTFGNHNTFLPNWQQHPLIPPRPRIGMPLNFDTWHLVAPPGTGQIREATGIQAAFDERRVTITQNGVIVTDPENEAQVTSAAGTAAWRAQHLHPDEDSTEPASTMHYPMFNNLDSIRLDLDQEQSAVGVFLYVFFWRDLIRDILTSDSNGVIVVFEHACGPSFTYRLDGPKTIYLGGGDLHQPEFDYLKESLTLNEIMRTSDNDRRGESAYTGIPLSDTFCQRSIHIYPSNDMQDDFITSDPVIFALAAALIFLFTSAVFVLYDCIVARRQRMVLERALTSGAIVSSLFPENVKEQLYEEKKQQQKTESNVSKFISNPDMEVNADITAGKPTTRPIADLFHNTTILFADLVGFTAWSAKRTPTEVFELLEAIYGCFDKIASRRKVFKVETIGDCYVAVTGIPKPQERHAVIMARFAHDCMMEMQAVLRNLVDALGEDTKDLQMRAGLHSGSTTAGVLRGTKGRFQLFGDTVNTAARMESNGVPSCIHVSQATADALIEAGKENWLVAREEKVTAKGKGLMQTYFVDIKHGKANSKYSAVSTSQTSQPSVDDDHDTMQNNFEEKDRSYAQDKTQESGPVEDVTV